MSMREPGGPEAASHAVRFAGMLKLGYTRELLLAPENLEVVERMAPGMREWLWYNDGTSPERACDNLNCGKLYRGPAVYCSLTCALVDADVMAFARTIIAGPDPATTA